MQTIFKHWGVYKTWNLTSYATISFYRIPLHWISFTDCC